MVVNVGADGRSWKKQSMDNFTEEKSTTETMALRRVRTLTGVYQI